MILRGSEYLILVFIEFEACRQGILSQISGKHRASQMCCYCSQLKCSKKVNALNCEQFKYCTINWLFGWAAILENSSNIGHKCRHLAILKSWKTKDLLL